MKQNLYEKNAARRPKLRFQAQHPLAALLYYIGVFAALFLFDSLFYSVVILIWMVPLACRTAGRRRALRLFGGALLFGGLLLLINPLINNEGLHILFYLGERPVTLESLLYGAHNLLLVAALLMVFPSFNILLDSERVLFLFSRLMHTSALILSMAMRFVPLLTRRARELRQLHRQEGARLPARLRHAGKLLGALLDWTMEEGMQSSRTLRARGYGGQSRTFYSAFRFTPRDAGALCFLLASLASLFGLRLLGAGKWLYFPAFDAPHIDLVQAAGLGALCLMCGYPFLLEAGSRMLCCLEARRRREILV
jgi:energy-coupling factor transport system permease protein